MVKVKKQEWKIKAPTMQGGFPVFIYHQMRNQDFIWKLLLIMITIPK